MVVFSTVAVGCSRGFLHRAGAYGWLPSRRTIRFRWARYRQDGMDREGAWDVTYHGVTTGRVVCRWFSFESRVASDCQDSHDASLSCVSDLACTGWAWGGRCKLLTGRTCCCYWLMISSRRWAASGLATWLGIGGCSTLDRIPISVTTRSCSPVAIRRLCEVKAMARLPIQMSVIQ